MINHNALVRAALGRGPRAGRDDRREAKNAPENCQDCNAPFDDADAPPHGLCAACYAGTGEDDHGRI